MFTSSIWFEASCKHPDERGFPSSWKRKTRLVENNAITLPLKVHYAGFKDNNPVLICLCLQYKYFWDVSGMQPLASWCVLLKMPKHAWKLQKVVQILSYTQKRVFMHDKQLGLSRFLDCNLPVLSNQQIIHIHENPCTMY